MNRTCTTASVAGSGSTHAGMIPRRFVSGAAMFEAIVIIGGVMLTILAIRQGLAFHREGEILRQETEEIEQWMEDHK